MTNVSEDASGVIANTPLRRCSKADRTCSPIAVFAPDWVFARTSRRLVCQHMDDQVNKALSTSMLPPRGEPMTLIQALAGEVPDWKVVRSTHQIYDQS